MEVSRIENFSIYSFLFLYGGYPMKIGYYPTQIPQGLPYLHVYEVSQTWYTSTGRLPASLPNICETGAFFVGMWTLASCVQWAHASKYRHGYTKNRLQLISSFSFSTSSAWGRQRSHQYHTQRQGNYQHHHKHQECDEQRCLDVISGFEFLF